MRQGRLITAAIVALAVLALPVAAGAGGGPVAPPHDAAGAVPAAGPGPAGRPSAPTDDAAKLEAAAGNGSTGNLTWHGGPVMHSNTTYTIFWSPSGAIPSGYQSLINQFLADVAHDSGARSNVYATDPQYTDGSGPAAYSSVYGGTWVDTSTSIPDHCSSEYSSTSVHVSGCVLDADLQSEVARAIAANGWTAGPAKLFLVFTPRNVGSCVDGTTKDCAYTSYCAYHSDFTQSSQPVLYTSQPYTDTSGVGSAGVCDSGQQPNGNWADETINVMSHEHNESVTDPLINAWYDSGGYENGDKCAWIFGTPLGGSPGSNGNEGTEWNQAINGHHYFVQQEWNNATSSCVQQLGSTVAAAAVSSFSPTSGGAGTAVTITGSNLTGATAVTFNGLAAASFTVASSTSITATVPAGASTGPVAVTTPGGVATSSSSFTVLPAPAITSLSPASGVAGTSVTITGANFTGATAVKFNGVAATFTVSKSTSISTKVPAGATTGPVTVTTSAGTGTSTVSFTVPVAPAITSFTPSGGAPGTAVTLTGVNFTGATAVKFNGTSASFTVTSATTITTTIPSGATSGAISVTTAGGTASSSVSFAVPVPDFTIAVSPGSATVTRGSRTSFAVTITRLNGFTGSVSLSVSGLAGGTKAPTASFSGSTLTISTTSSTATGTATLTITGTSGSLKHTATVGLTVQ